MSTSLSRRKALQAGLSAAIFPLLTTKQAVSQVPSAITWSNLEITPSVDGNFSSMMGQHFPGLLQDATAVTLSSLFYLLVNNSQHPLTALEVEWTFTAGDNTETAHDVELVRSGMDRWYTGAVPLIAPGEIRLLTPFFCWSPKAYAAAAQPINWQKALTSNETTQYRAFHMGSVTQVAMQPMNAVWDNRYVTVKPEGEFAKTFIVTRNGEHDAAYDVRKKMKAGADIVALDQFLTQRVLPLTTKERTALERRYVEARRRESILLLQALRTKTYSQFQHITKKIAAKPRTVLTALPQA